MRDHDGIAVSPHFLQGIKVSGHHDQNHGSIRSNSGTLFEVFQGVTQTINNGSLLASNALSSKYLSLFLTFSLADQQCLLCFSLGLGSLRIAALSIYVVHGSHN